MDPGCYDVRDVPICLLPELNFGQIRTKRRSEPHAQYCARRRRWVRTLFRACFARRRSRALDFRAASLPWLARASLGPGLAVAYLAVVSGSAMVSCVIPCARPRIVPDAGARTAPARVANRALRA